MQEKYDCDYYGYINGDILLSSSIIQTLRNISNLIQQHKLFPRVLITGRRTNGDVPLTSRISHRVLDNDAIIAKMAREGSLFREDALVRVLENILDNIIRITSFSPTLPMT